MGEHSAMNEILFLRHAEPDDAGLYIGRGSNPSLSEKGRNDAAGIAEVMAETAPAVFVSSPLARALETIEPLAKKLGRRIEIVDDIAEMDFGEWEGLNWNQIESQDGDFWRSWLDDPWTVKPPGGETLAELQERVVAAVHDILRRHHSSDILISTHGGPMRTIIGYALSLSASAYWSVGIDYASLCRFRYESHDILNLMQWNVPIVSK